MPYKENYRNEGDEQDSQYDDKLVFHGESGIIPGLRNSGLIPISRTPEWRHNDEDQLARVNSAIYHWANKQGYTLDSDLDYLNPDSQMNFEVYDGLKAILEGHIVVSYHCTNDEEVADALSIFFPTTENLSQGELDSLEDWINSMFDDEQSKF